MVNINFFHVPTSEVQKAIWMNKIIVKYPQNHKKGLRRGKRKSRKPSSIRMKMYIQDHMPLMTLRYPLTFLFLSILSVELVQIQS